MIVKIETPPVLSGTADAQLRQVYSFLFRLSENLNVAFKEINAVSAAEKKADATAVENKQQSNQATVQGYNELRALIMNTAETVQRVNLSLGNSVNALEQTVRNDIEVLNYELLSELTAISSEWGTFRETIHTEMETTAEAVVASYDYDAAIETLQEQAVGFSKYQILTEGYIKQGFIDYDSDGVPIIGVAIGQNLLGTKVTIDGQEYEQLDATQSCAFYTAEKVSFRINGQEVAYVSNQKLYIHEAEITTGRVTLGGVWQMTTSNGFAIKWIGGDG